MRWQVELDHRQLKGELGLDHYEGRSYLGFHHHTALVTCAHAFLTLERLVPKSPAAGLTLPQAVLLLQPVLKCWAGHRRPATNPSTSTNSHSSPAVSNKVLLWEAPTMSSMRQVGLDVHARETTGVVWDAVTGEVEVRRIAGRPDRVVDWLATIAPPFQAVYQAGPTGYGLARRARARGLDVAVCAPGHILKSATDRIKTDKRDALRLARLLGACELPADPHPRAGRGAAARPGAGARGPAR